MCEGESAKEGREEREEKRKRKSTTYPGWLPSLHNTTRGETDQAGARSHCCLNYSTQKKKKKGGEEEEEEEVE